MLRFHYYNAVYEWWWEVDDVQLGQCQPYTINLPLMTAAHPAQTAVRATVTYTLKYRTPIPSHTLSTC